jgi:hypothetical protein
MIATLHCQHLQDLPFLNFNPCLGAHSVRSRINGIIPILHEICAKLEQGQHRLFMALFFFFLKQGRQQLALQLFSGLQLPIGNVLPMSC